MLAFFISPADGLVHSFSITNSEKFQSLATTNFSWTITVYSPRREDAIFILHLRWKKTNSGFV